MDLKEINLENTNRHPWEISRRSIVFRFISPFLSPCSTLTDIGSGDLYFIKSFKNVGQRYAFDLGYSNGFKEDNLLVSSSSDVVPDGSSDIVFLLDVLEHVEQEEEILNVAKSKLNEKGKLVVTVPAWQVLFSSHDTKLAHFRRYSPKQLLSVLTRNGFKVKEFGTFYFTLSLLRALTVFKEKLFKPNLDKKIEALGHWPFPSESLINGFILRILHLDFLVCRFFSRFGIVLPGLSIIVIAEVADE